MAKPFQHRSYMVLPLQNTDGTLRLDERRLLLGRLHRVEPERNERHRHQRQQRRSPA
jgi:hypothetical protein